MPIHHDQFVVITGGAGAGKTTLIDRLAAAGFGVKAEAGRAVIKDQVAVGGPALPWLDPALFADVCLGWELRAHRAATVRATTDPGPVFFDRGLIDCVAYYPWIGQPVPARLQRALQMYRYHRIVFIAPPWREIFCNDAERKQTFDEGVEGCRVLAETYSRYGHELVELPRVSVDERVEFVLDVLGRPAIRS